LGADYNLDPFVPSADIHGDKYQWGYKEPIIKQKDDVYQSSPVPGWNIVEKTNTWDKGIDDPCPTGYRVPSKEEWENVRTHNTTQILGNWAASPTARYADGGMMFGDNLMFPTAGLRAPDGRTKNDKGAGIAVWLADRHINFFVKNYGKQIHYYHLYPSAAVPVRCIKK